MIILRKIDTNSGQLCGVMLSDDLVGVRDEDNQIFTVSNEYNSGRIEIIYNGQVLTSPTDFTETGPKEITFIYLKPGDDTVLRANYEMGDCGGTGSLDFTDLNDTPSNYTTASGKLVAVKDDESGLEFIDFSPGSSSFVQLVDTPTTYSGFENYFVKVNDTGDGLVFEPPEGGVVQEGIENVPNNVSSTAVTFANAFPSSDYVLTISLANEADVEPSIYPTLITNKTTTGFTVDFSGEIDSTNYYLNWRATISGTAGGGGGLCELSEDLTPELGGNLEVGDHLIMLDPAPNGMTTHGYEIGASGDASEMYVHDNAGNPFACPLYMRSDGRWAACTAVSGTTQMPCAALSLEEDDGGVKKILWRGTIRKGSWSWTPNDLIYVSTVEGALTNVEPNAGAWSQIVGIAISSDTIRFDPGFNPGYINT